MLTALNASPGKPLLANAYQERYMPGSSFKVITTSIALRERRHHARSQSSRTRTSWVPPQTTDPIQNYGGTSCAAARWSRSSTAAATSRSPNWPPSSARRRWSTARKKWGIGEKMPIDLPAPAASSFGEVSDFTDQLPLLAIGGFGQGSTTMVPLHMAMVASTVANGGVMMKPHVIDATLDHDGNVLTRTTPSPWKTPIAAATADTLTTLMIGVVNQGTGKPMQLAGGIQAAAKTGTAQLNTTGAGALQRVDHRLRSGGGSAVRDRGRLEGRSRRRDQRQHRRQAGRTDRQDSARLPLRPSDRELVGDRP